MADRFKARVDEFSTPLDTDITEAYLTFYNEAVQRGHFLPHEVAQIGAFVAGQLYSKVVWQAFCFLRATEDYTFEQTANLLIQAMNEGSLYEATRVNDGYHPQLGDSEGDGIPNATRAINIMKRAGCFPTPGKESSKKD